MLRATVPLLSQQLNSISSLSLRSHNPKSPQSLVALSLLRKAQNGQDVLSNADASSSTSSSSSASTRRATEAIAGEDVEPSVSGPHLGRGEQFLADARADTSQSLEIEVEVKERSKEPPTQAQIQTILDYLKDGASLALNLAPSAGGSETSAHSTSHPAATGMSAGNPLPSPGKSITRAKQSQSQPQTSSTSASPAWSEVDSSSVVDQLKNSDLLLVDWENGRAVTNLQGVKMLLALLKREQLDPTARSQSDAGTGTGCIAM